MILWARGVEGMDTEEAIAGFVFERDSEATNLAVSRGTAAQPYWMVDDMVLERNKWFGVCRYILMCGKDDSSKRSARLEILFRVSSDVILHRAQLSMEINFNSDGQ